MTYRLYLILFYFIGKWTVTRAHQASYCFPTKSPWVFNGWSLLGGVSLDLLGGIGQWISVKATVL